MAFVDTSQKGDTKERKFFFLLLFLFVVAQVFMAFSLSPVDDELYYWAWAQKLLLSYYDHPPMVAYFIAVSTQFFGSSIFGIRFFSVLSSLLVVWTLHRLAKGKTVFTCLLLTPLALLGGVLITPDVPFLLFWTLYFDWFYQMNQVPAQERRVSWGVGGIFLGLGLLSKYSMALAIPCTFFSLLAWPNRRQWLKGFLLELFVASFFLLPVLVFNLRQDFAPLRYQWGHTLGASHGNPKDFLASQVALLGLLPLVSFPWLLWNAKSFFSRKTEWASFCFFMFPFSFVLLQSFRTYLEANWGLMSYIAFWPLAQNLFDGQRFFTRRKSVLVLLFLPSIVVTLALVAHLVKPISLLPPEKDRIAKIKTLYDLSKDIAADIRASGFSGRVFISTYQWVSYLRYQGISAEQLFPGTKPSTFTLFPVNPCLEAKVYSLTETTEVPQALECFPHHTVVKGYVMVARGKEIGKNWLMEHHR